MKDKIELRDVTFLIPMRLDGIKRLENLLLVVDYLNTSFETNIRILEASPYDNGLLKALLPACVERFFVEDFDPIFHRTYYINRMVEEVCTPIISVWDTDVIAPEVQVAAAVELLRTGEADFVHPYKDKFLDTSFIIRELYCKTRDIEVLENNQNRMRELYAPKPVGGAFLADREKYIAAGMETEAFYGWGVEDGERVGRWRALGYQWKRTEGTLYHLTHERGVNSHFHSKGQEKLKKAMLYKLASMSKPEVQEMLNERG